MARRSAPQLNCRRAIQRVGEEKFDRGQILFLTRGAIQWLQIRFSLAGFCLYIF